MTEMLTPTQLRVVEAIRELTTPEGVGPTYPEIAAIAGVHKSGVHRIAGELKAKGIATNVPGKARTLRLVEERLSRPRLERLSTEALTEGLNLIASIILARGGRVVFDGAAFSPDLPESTQRHK